ncbi:MAG: transcription-repair coupling factor, partial [Firmicutes bacterium]|nr:transcription-repair coupling factor [Bacillota bacterium]
YIGYFYDSPENILDYMNDPLLMIDDPAVTFKYYEDRIGEFFSDFEVMLERGRAVPEDKGSFPELKDYLEFYSCENRNVYIFTPFAGRIKHIGDFAEIRSIQGRQTPAFGGHLDVFEKELKGYISKGYEVNLVCPDPERVENMRQYIGHMDMAGAVNVLEGQIMSGIDLPGKKQCWIRDEDVFSIRPKRKKKRHPASAKGSRIRSFSDIAKGDYVVHESYGIGRFLGIEQVTVQGVRNDYLKIKYAGTAMLYVPVDNMDVIQKYVGSDSVSPRLNNLSGFEWKVTKAKAKEAITHMAEELIATSAARKIEKGYSFSRDSEWQEQFEADFPFTETDDQLKAAEEIKEDMESAEPMDRLLCGDVGFGKTEVAARAVFKCLAEGKQAAMLVPTTILANQHYYTLKERFEKFPFKVEMMSRFRSQTQQAETAEKLAKGEVDFVIGTHRLLSKDVKFKDLGLLVIDEEQRFGVQHKEKIKQLKHNVDVLTLSATPIPRTLHMSLSGIRDMSLIEEPPEDRYPVQTYVAEQDDDMIREAISREIDRGGQVYVVFNRVRGINQIATRIRNLLPGITVGVGHGQMNEETLENVLMDFVSGQTDVLVSTTIIESGMDIPNVNTMIVMDADRYGLSQLYQLRGRVGRSNRIAYAYLMYKKDKVLTEKPAARLRAIREFTEFGAGFRIAMRDMEMRGAGNLLGTEQHGHMLKIGYELYFKLVDNAVRKLRGEETMPEEDGPVVELGEPAFIPDRYISDEILKLQMYKRIAEIESREDEEDVTDELIDRFGDIPGEVGNLIKISRIRSLAAKCRFDKVSRKNGRIYFRAEEGGGPGAEGMANAAAEFGVRLFIHGGVEPEIRYTPEKGQVLSQVIKVLEAFSFSQ